MLRTLPRSATVTCEVTISEYNVYKQISKTVHKSFWVLQIIHYDKLVRTPTYKPLKQSGPLGGILEISPNFSHTSRDLSWERFSTQVTRGILVQDHIFGRRDRACLTFFDCKEIKKRPSCLAKRLKASFVALT